MERSIESLLRDAVARLGGQADEAQLDAEVLLAHCLGVTRSHLYAWPEREVPTEVRARLTVLLDRRAAGEPLAYVLGEKEFWSLSLSVTPHTLIPRPETELLVSETLKRCPANARILELGTGSGAVAIALASERPDASIVATDASPDALKVATANAMRHGLTNIRFRQSPAYADWFEDDETERYDLVVSNPPYVEEGDPGLGEGALRFEPRAALAAGPDGLRDLSRIIAGAPACLAPGAWLLVEHGFSQAGAIAEMMGESGLGEIETVRDIAGLPRVTLGRRP